MDGQRPAFAVPSFNNTREEMNYYTVDITFKLSSLIDLLSLSLFLSFFLSPSLSLPPLTYNSLSLSPTFSLPSLLFHRPLNDVANWIHTSFYMSIVLGLSLCAPPSARKTLNEHIHTTEQPSLALHCTALDLARPFQLDLYYFQTNSRFGLHSTRPSSDVNVHKPEQQAQPGVTLTRIMARSFQLDLRIQMNSPNGQLFM